MQEDKLAYQYKGPDKALRERYADIFTLANPLPDRPSKLVFDKIISLAIIIAVLPLLAIFFSAFLVYFMLFPEDRGPVFTSYVASSRGRKFIKYKFRITKSELVDNAMLKIRDYRAYPSERKPENLTRIGRFLKRRYLDEFPQLFNIFKGDMSLVGPRALAWHHYLRNLREGDVSRKILKAGLFSESHTRKGTPFFGKPELEYQYIEKYMTATGAELLKLDISIIARGVRMILEGKGY